MRRDVVEGVASLVLVIAAFALAGWAFGSIRVFAGLLAVYLLIAGLR